LGILLNSEWVRLRHAPLAAIVRSPTGYISNDSTVMMRCLACITGRTDEHHKAVLDRFIDHPEASP
jgi:hypothetical protein